MENLCNTLHSSGYYYLFFPRDCLFIGGEEESGGILIAEEAFYQSLLELEFQNPEYLQVSSDN